METNQERSAVEKLIFSYGNVFNTKDIAQTVALYAPDGILMPNNAPLAQGTEQLTASFELLLRTFKIKIHYVIDEIVFSGDYAFARTNSKVETLVKATGEHISLQNKELFVLRKLYDEWKISHYIFNNTSMVK
jgi:ketosteroid isomerase-like protein